MTWAIFDQDGTLADITHRLHFIKGIRQEGDNEWSGVEKKDWDGFNSHIHLDKPKPDIVRLNHMAFKECMIAIVTGRSEQYRQATEAWLKQHNIHYHELLMRKQGDFRSDYIVKQEIYDTHFKGQRQVLFAIDDRDQVVDMWRRNGITTLQCQKGDY